MLQYLYQNLMVFRKAFSRSFTWFMFCMVITVTQSYPSALPWNPVGLPENYYPLLLSNWDAFTSKGTTLVGYGGISIQEVTWFSTNNDNIKFPRLYCCP